MQSEIQSLRERLHAAREELERIDARQRVNEARINALEAACEGQSDQITKVSHDCTVLRGNIITTLQETQRSGRYDIFDRS